MRYTMTKFWMSVATTATLCVMHAAAQTPEAFLTAMQLPIEDLDLGLGDAERAPARTPDPNPNPDPDWDLNGLLDDPVPAPAPVEPEPEPVEPDPEAPSAEVPPALPAAETDEVTAAAVDLSEPVRVIVSEMEALERVRREATDRHGLGALQQAQTAIGRGNFDEAIRLFEEALDFIGDRPSNAMARRTAEDGLMEAHYRNALMQQQRGNLQEARRAAVAARLAGHPKGEDLVVEIDRLITDPPPPPPVVVERRWEEPSYQADQDRSAQRMRRAREFYATGEYDASREQLELIMRDNPFHTEAITMLQRLGARRYDVAHAEFEATRREMIHEVKSVWTPRNYARDLTDIGPTDPSFVPEPTTLVDVRIQEKMRNIIIPEINFRAANLIDVITFLGDASREYDSPDVPAEQRGINIILTTQLPSAPRAPRAAPGDPFAEPRDVGDPSAPGVDVPVTFQARYVSLYDALQIVMNLADLKYRIRGNVVIVMPSNFPEGELMHRMYNVLPTLVDRMASFRDERTDTAGPGAVWGMQQATIDVKSDWKEFFSQLGVEWPEGSTVQHMPTIGKLVVRNTSENLSTLETVLAVLNVTPRQVEIEARFVEVMQSDLESMGFEWLMNNNWQVLEHRSDLGLPPDARRRVEVQGGNMTRGFDFLNVDGVGGSAPVMDNILTVNSVLTNPELSMVLHMLSQRKNTDLLSAPKVVTKNGSEAIIKVVTEYIYPTEFTVEGLTADTQQTAQTIGAVVEPGGFETREVGVILQVVPDVTPDGQMIDLTLAPQVVSEPLWRNYGSTYTDAAGNTVQLNMEQPFFPVRSISTSIQIYNGATVVMGGMITEVRQTNEDKVPILGDIPLLGRLFRYKYEHSEKRNLLIFVTARLVDPAGRVVRDRDDLPMLPGL